MVWFRSLRRCGYLATKPFASGLPPRLDILSISHYAAGDMAEERQMTREYAELSLRAGLMAGAADAELGGTKFIRRSRRHAWKLTEEKLAKWKAEAIRLGVPPDALELPPEIEAMFPVWVELGMQAQAEHDKSSKF